MIQVNELRICVYLFDTVNNRIVKCDGINPSHDAVWVNYANGAGQYQLATAYLEPIPITPDVLKACGFECGLDYIDVLGFDLLVMHLHDISFTFRNGIIEQNQNKIGNARCEHITNLHQLQNILSSLTGKELNIDMQALAEATGK